jgi:malonyl CoA-acyl carrier protein transacylase
MSQQQRFLHQKRLRKPDYTLTAPVKWTQQQMIADGATLFTEVGPGKY